MLDAPPNEDSVDSIKLHGTIAKGSKMGSKVCGGVCGWSVGCVGPSMP